MTAGAGCDYFLLPFDKLYRHANILFKTSLCFQVLSSYPLELDTLQPVFPENILLDENVETIPPPAALYLQLGKRAVKKLPDAVLLGSLVIISTELLQVGIYTFFCYFSSIL